MTISTTVSYFLFPIITLIVLLAFSLLFKRAPRGIKRGILFTIALLNVAQHLLKSALYPHLWGTGFTYRNTAYNMCAFLILATPIVYASHSQAWKDFSVYLGTAASTLAMLFPYWFWLDGETDSWEILRFYVCHSLLFLSSILPVALGVHRVSLRSWWKVGLLFFLSIILIVFNDILMIALGLCENGTLETLYPTLTWLNPVWVMAPPPQFTWIADFIAPITPNLFFHNGQFVPLLWYAIPLYVLISLGALFFGLIAHRKEKRQKDRPTVIRGESV